MNKERQELIQKLEQMTNCDVYILFTSGGEQFYSISPEILPVFTKSIFSRRKGRHKNAILVLETNGGDPTTVMAVVKQLRESYKKIYQMFQRRNFGYVCNRRDLYVAICNVYAYRSSVQHYPRTWF